MRTAALLLALAFGTLGGCTAEQIAQARTEPDCLVLFRNYDQAIQAFGNSVSVRNDQLGWKVPTAVDRAGQRLRENGCLTSDADLAPSYLLADDLRGDADRRERRADPADLRCMPASSRGSPARCRRGSSSAASACACAARARRVSAGASTSGRSPPKAVSRRRPRLRCRPVSSRPIRRASDARAGRACAGRARGRLRRSAAVQRPLGLRRAVPGIRPLRAAAAAPERRSVHRARAARPAAPTPHGPAGPERLPDPLPRSGRPRRGGGGADRADGSSRAARRSDGRWRCMSGR